MRAPGGACAEGEVGDREISLCTCSTEETDIVKRGQAVK